MKIFYLYMRDGKRVYVKVDDGDAHLLRSMNWRAAQGKSGPTVARHIPGGGKQTLARFLLDVTDENVIVAHTNGDQLDCRRANLRLVPRGNQLERIRKKRFAAAARAFGMFSCGHPRTPENTYAGMNCKACALQSSKEKYSRKKARKESQAESEEFQ